MFETHKLNETGHEAVKEFKTAMALAVRTIDALLPEQGCDVDKFNAKIEEAVFFGTKAIASRPENHTEVVTY